MRLRSSSRDEDSSDIPGVLADPRVIGLFRESASRICHSPRTALVVTAWLRSTDLSLPAVRGRWDGAEVSVAGFRPTGDASPMIEL